MNDWEQALKDDGFIITYDNLTMSYGIRKGEFGIRIAEENLRFTKDIYAYVADAFYRASQTPRAVKSYATNTEPINVTSYGDPYTKYAQSWQQTAINVSASPHTVTFPSAHNSITYADVPARSIVSKEEVETLLEQFAERILQQVCDEIDRIEALILKDDDD